MSSQHEIFDPEELNEVRTALMSYELQCRELSHLLREETMTRVQQANAMRRYSELKGAIKRDAKRGTVGGEKREKTRSEVCFFAGAVSHAAIALAPATSATRVVRAWAGALVNAQREISYYLHKLESSVGAGTASAP